MAQLAIALLGSARITLDGRDVAGLGAKGRALLAYLALNAGQPQHRAAVAGLLWPHSENPRKNLRVELVRVQKALGQPLIEAFADDLLRISPACELWLDANEFAALIDLVAAHAHANEQLCPECAQKLARAADLYTGDLLAEIDHIPELEALLEWAEPHRSRLHLQACSVFGRLYADAERRSEAAAATRYARRALALDPADEAAHCCLIRLFLGQSRFSDAALQYELCRSALADLGAQPGSEAAELFRQITQRRRPGPPASSPRPRRQAGPTPSAREYERTLMLERVAAWWQIELRVGQAAGRPLIDIELAYAPDAVAAPGNLPARGRPPTSSARVAAVFDQAGGELLILGAPGAGKTTLLLQLVKALLARAQADPRQPIPVVFALSSWARARPLAEWCAEQLKQVYGVPLDIGQSWIVARYLLPLFDGLDEVRAEERATCIAALNQFRQEYGLIKLAVCCRSDQYYELGDRLALPEAVEVQPLTSRQIDHALATAPGQLGAVRAIIAGDPALQQIVATPLMLSFLEEAYQRINLSGLPQLSPAERQRYLSNAYVECQLAARARRRNRPRWGAPALTRWIGWLAQRMQSLHEPLFFLDHLSPLWLAHSRQRAAYAAGEKLVFGLIVGLVSGVIWSLDGGLARRTLATPLARLAFGITTPNTVPELVALLRAALGATMLISLGMALAVWLATWLVIERRNRLGGTRRHVHTALVIGCTVGVFDGLLAGRWNGLVVSSDGSRQLLANLGLGLLTGLATGLGAGFVYWRAVQPGRVLLVEQFRWSWRVARRWLARGVGVGLALGAIYGLTVGASAGVIVGLLYGMALGLANGAVAGLLCGALLGVERDTVAKRMEPNQGIRLSAAAAARSGGLAWLAVSLTAVAAASLASVYFFQPNNPSALPWIVVWNCITWSIWALSFGVGTALLNGGFACLQHVLLRAILRAGGAMPWRYVHLLDEAVACNLLVRAGGGYYFTHELILQHFAAQAAPQHPAEPPEPPLIERTV